MSNEGLHETVRRFDFLASAIAGRQISVSVDPDNHLSYWGGRTLFLSARRVADEADIWLDVVAQALLVGCGSLRHGMIGRLIGRPAVARRYAFLEVMRGIELAAERLPAAFSRHPALQPRPNWRSARSAEESLQWAANRRLSLDDIPDFIGILRPVLLLRTSRDAGDTLALTSRERAGALNVADASAAIPDDQESESSSLLDHINSRFTQGNPISQALSELFGLGHSRGGTHGKDEGGGGELPVGWIEQAWQRGTKALRANLPFALPESASQAGVDSSAKRFPEWDYRRVGYRPNWVRVEEGYPQREEGPLDLSKVLLAPSPQMRRQLSTLGREYEMHRRQRDGAEFDIGPLIEHAIELCAGHTPANLDIYRASRRTRRDLGVLVALDISGSTGERNTQGERVFDQQLRAAWQLTRTLDELGDRVALYGFHSWGRELTCIVRLKGHQEPWSGIVGERCALLEPCGYTRTGGVVRFAAQFLNESMRLPNRLMILVTDGLAYDRDYEDQYAREDTRMALHEAHAAGVACVCLCIGGSATAEQLEQVFGSANVLMVDDADQWVSRIGEVCRRALGSARMVRQRGARKTPSKRLTVRSAGPDSRRELVAPMQP